MIDIKTQSNLERKGFTWLINHLVKSEDLKQEPEAGTEVETTEERCCCWLAYSGLGPPTGVTDMALGQSNGDNSFTAVSSSMETPVCGKLNASQLCQLESFPTFCHNTV